jgi:hypothetical protein
MNIDIPKHTNFICGYMDAMVRAYSGGEHVIGLSAIIIPCDSSVEEELSCRITSSEEIENLSHSFCKELSILLNTDSREKVLFYLVEYLTWYKEYTISCKCLKLELSGASVPLQHAAYLFHINSEFNVLVYFFRSPVVEGEA